LNPNAEAPVFVDSETTVLGSHASPLFLAAQSGQFLAPSMGRGPMLSMRMFLASGVGPFSGQGRHFMHDAPDPNPCAPNHGDFEAWRHWKMRCTHPADQPWMVGGRYTLLDMAVRRARLRRLRRFDRTSFWWSRHGAPVLEHLQHPARCRAGSTALGGATGRADRPCAVRPTAPAFGVISARDLAEDFGTLPRHHEPLGGLACGQ